jgi:DNA polymerase-1
LRVVIDIEANGLENPDRIWLIVCKDIDTGQLHIFKEEDREKFIEYSKQVTLWIGHNVLGYDFPCLINVWGFVLPPMPNVIDTLIISKLSNYSRDGHSIESYGLEFGYPKGEYSDFSKYTPEMETYCVRDVEICHRVYNALSKYIDNPNHRDAINLEHQFQLIVNALHDNGFAFDSNRATRLLARVEGELAILDEEILKEFPNRLRPVREIHPKETKHGTLNRSDFRWVSDGDLSSFNGGPFSRCEWVSFNPSSHKQIIEVLSLAGWKPTEKTKTHIDTERQLKRRDTDPKLIPDLKNKLIDLQKTGWKISETNLATLPSTAPKPARTLAKRIMLESRRRTLHEWTSLVRDDGRIHGKFYGIGAWTHRMAHQNPNTANIPTEAKLFGKEMRSVWIAPKGRLLVGVDAEGIQLRIFAHYINDEEFTDALVRGRKDDKTDPHSLNQRVLGHVCKGRQIAKRFIYALLLGAGIDKLAEILCSSRTECQEALNRLLERYTGFAHLKENVIPKDAKRGYFIGLDGRSVKIPGDTEGSKRHLCMSGYLQNGEAIVMKKACTKFSPLLSQYNAFLVDFVHDEWQTECPNDFKIAMEIAELQANSLKIVGEELKLNCPLAGSYWNDDHKDYTIGTNWYQTH